MLTESFVLSRALEKAGLALEAQHPSVKVPGISTGPVIRVCLDTKGTIVRCESVVEENLSGLWGHFDGNHNSFPVIRLPEPLMVLPPAELRLAAEKPKDTGRRKPTAEDRRKGMVEKVRCAQPKELTEKTVNLLVRLRQKASRLVDVLEGQNDAVARVCRAYNLIVPEEAKEGSDLRPVPLLAGLREHAIKWLEVCDDSDLDALEALLFAAGGKDGKKAQLALDVDDPAATIYRGEIRKAVASAFLRSDEARIPVGELRSPVCAYTGKADLWTGPFPKVKLPVLGREFYIFSMNSDAECNVRYGLKDAQIVPVARDPVLRMQDSLNAILKMERRGKTWRSIAGEKVAASDLLIVYVDGRPDIPVAVADFFGQSGDVEVGQFDADASAVCEALDGIKQVEPGTRLNLFVLRKASEGQAFVVLAETPSVEEVLKGAEWWQSAARNIPLGAPADDYVVSLPILAEDNKSRRQKPSVPYPGQVAALLTQAWSNTSGGSASGGRAPRNKLRGALFGEVLDLMLQRPAKARAAAAHVLSLCLDRAGPLLNRLAECQHAQAKERWSSYGDKERLTGLRGVSVIGIALYGMGSKKEDYMRESAFQVGQLLALADRLHRCYCTVVRDKAMPPNLIGNAVFDAALNSPEKALATLAERIRVYQGWAATVEPDSTDEKRHIAALEAKKVLRLYKPLTLKLHEQGLPQRLDDVMKAHLLLGYLAGQENDERTERAD